jgi:hypothetical protein
MKHLKVEYTTESGQSITLFDGQVTEVTWSDGPNGIKVEGKNQAAATGGGMGGLLEMLTGASKSRTAAVVEEKKAELAAEAVPAPQQAWDDSIEVIQAAQG